MDKTEPLTLKILDQAIELVKQDQLRSKKVLQAMRKETAAKSGQNG